MENILEQIRIFFFGKERTLIKTIINWGFVLLVIAGFAEYGIDHNGDMSGLLKKETWETKPSEPINEVNNTIYIRPIGDVDNSKLVEASKTISNKFGVETKIIDGIDFTNDMKYPNYNKINPHHTVSMINEGLNVRIINIVEGEMTDEDGITTIMGVTLEKTMLISTYSPFEQTLIHEFGHSLGLSHCLNSHCVMSTFANGYDVSFGTNFCDNCKLKLN